MYVDLRPFRPDDDVRPGHVDTADRTIRNQRYHGWPVWACLGVWAGLWIPAVLVADKVVPPHRHTLAGAGCCSLMMASFVVTLRHLDARPVQRIKLGDELRAFPLPGRRHTPADIRTVRFESDDDEDFAEGDLPVPRCRVTIVTRKGRPYRLVASAGDAVRLREWAQGHGVPVVDPHGLAGGPSEKP
jgi:hypothetical protein